MKTNTFEQRYVPYEEVSEEDWAKMEEYLSDYMYIYMFGTDSLTKVLTSELFSFMFNRLESKAKISEGIVSKNTEFMKKRKYSYLSGRGSEIPLIF